MSNKNLVPWKSHSPSIIISKNSLVPAILDYAVCLSERDRGQITKAFDASSYEMVSGYVWNKTMRYLRKKLEIFGIKFIAEMLGKDDVDQFSKIEDIITDSEAIELSFELGIIDKTGAFRLRQSKDLVNHFANLDDIDAEEVEMDMNEALGVLKTCVQYILMNEETDESPISNFVLFRNKITEFVLSEDSPEVEALFEAAYFFKRTTVNVLLSEVVITSSAKLEIILANASVIITKIWKSLADAERFQVGRVYSELIAGGNEVGSSGLRKILLNVKGFDYVPEDLRSLSFVRAAKKLLEAHEGMNNFYNEPEPAKYLSQMGNIIPAPAFAACMTAIMASRLGNMWGISTSAQKYLEILLKNIKKDRWEYYFSKCLNRDQVILRKLLTTSPRARMRELIIKEKLDQIEITNPLVNNLIQAIFNNDSAKVERAVYKLLEDLGYGNE